MALHHQDAVFLGAPWFCCSFQRCRNAIEVEKPQPQGLRTHLVKSQNSAIQGEFVPVDALKYTENHACFHARMHSTQPTLQGFHDRSSTSFTLYDSGVLAPKFLERPNLADSDAFCVVTTPILVMTDAVRTCKKTPPLNTCFTKPCEQNQETDAARSCKKRQLLHS